MENFDSTGRNCGLAGLTAYVSGLRWGDFFGLGWGNFDSPVGQAPAASIR